MVEGSPSDSCRALISASRWVAASGSQREECGKGERGPLEGPRALTAWHSTSRQHSRSRSAERALPCSAWRLKEIDEAVVRVWKILGFDIHGTS